MPSAPASGVVLMGKLSGATGRSWYIAVNTTGTVKALLRNAADTAWITAQTTGIYTDNHTRIIRAWSDGTNFSVRIGSELITVAGDVGRSGAGSQLGIGASGSGTLNTAAVITDVLVCNRAVTVAEDKQIMDYLDWKFVPYSINGIDGRVLDLDGNEGITIATGVSNWADTAPDATVPHDAAQTDPAKQAVYTVSDPLFNGNGSLAFDGVDDFLTIPSHADFELPGGISWYFVMAPVSKATDGYFLAKRGTAGTDTSYRFKANGGAAGGVSLLTRNAANTGDYGVALANVVKGELVVLRVIHDTSSHENRAKTANIAEAAAAALDEVVSSTGTLNVGALNTAGSLYAQMALARIVIFNRAVTPAEDFQIMQYLVHKYTPKPFSSGFSDGFQGNNL
jgi:hypothetical protein